MPKILVVTANSKTTPLSFRWNCVVSVTSLAKRLIFVSLMRRN
jgi:hypothetical protein